MRYTGAVSKRYDQYCPIAHALDLVGERWALLIVRELLQGPQRYTDLAAKLPGCGTNILAGRLKDLENGGILAKRRLPPPAASQVYELTPYGLALKPVIRELAVWGIRSLGPPDLEREPEAGWLEHALGTVFAPVAPPGSFEFRIGDEVASIRDGVASAGSINDADVVVQGPDPASFYFLFVQSAWDGVTVTGDRELLERLLDVASAPAIEASGAPVAA
jgi:DNA-binding HxlR family transcriptional regulator